MYIFSKLNKNHYYYYYYYYYYYCYYYIIITITKFSNLIGYQLP